MIVSHHSELDGTSALGGFGVAPAVCTLRLRHDVHRTGPPAALIGRGAARHLDAVRATFESSMLPNPPRTGLATEWHGAKTNVSARLTLSGDRGAGCLHTPVREQRRAERVIDTTARMQRGQPGARQIAEAVPTLRLELIAASIRAEAAAKPTGDTE